MREEMQLHIEAASPQTAEPGRERGRLCRPTSVRQPASLQEVSSEAWGWAAWERFGQDFRLGARTLRKTPGFTAIAVLTLALGLGINTAIFSVVNAVMIRSLPYPESGRLISLWEEATPLSLDNSVAPGESWDERRPERTTVSVANLVLPEEQPRVHGPRGVRSHADEPHQHRDAGTNLGRVRLGGVLRLSLPGIGTAQGRTFLPEDDGPDANPVVILTDGFWQRRLGADTNVLSRTIMLDGKPGGR